MAPFALGRAPSVSILSTALTRPGQRSVGLFVGVYGRLFSSGPSPYPSSLPPFLTTSADAVRVPSPEMRILAR